MFKTMDTESHPARNALTVWGQILSHLQPSSPEQLPNTDPKQFHGRLRLAHLGDLRVSLLHATEHCLHNKPPAITGKTRREYVLIMAMSGEISVSQGNDCTSLGSNQALLINISHPLDTVYHSPASCLQVMIPEARLKHLHKILPEQTPSAIDCETGLGMILRNQALGMIGGLSDITCDKVCHALGEQLISLLTLTMNHVNLPAQPITQEQQRLETILAAIDQQLENPDISTDSVASAACISRAYLFKLLKRHQTTFRTEVLNRRLERAKLLLKDPNLEHVPVSDIAWRLGFNSHSHFSRTFQKIAGISPTDFRRQEDIQEDTQEQTNLELDFSLGAGW